MYLYGPRRHDVYIVTKIAKLVSGGFKVSDDRAINERGAVVGMRTDRNTEVVRENLPWCHWPPQISHALTWHRTRTTVVESRRRLSAWAVARPLWGVLLVYKLLQTFQWETFVPQYARYVSLFLSFSSQVSRYVTSKFPTSSLGPSIFRHLQIMLFSPQCKRPYQ
jgi:hypothetical protein